MPRGSNAINKPHAAQIAERWIEDQGLAILLNAPQYGGFEIAVDVEVDEIVQTDFSGTGSQVYMKEDMRFEAGRVLRETQEEGARRLVSGSNVNGM